MDWRSFNPLYWLGVLSDGTTYTLNDKTVKGPEDVIRQLQNKKHDKICPEHFFLKFFPSMSTSKCVFDFAGMEPNTRYISVRSQDLAHKIHLENIEKGIVDIEPLRDGFTAIGVGVAAWGIGKGVGIPSLIRAWVVVRGRNARRA
jgi:hypothetical protein